MSRMATADRHPNPTTDDHFPRRATLLVTCVANTVTPEVAEATVQVLRAAGCEVTCSLSQTCCGQPAWQAGFTDEAASVARTTLNALQAELAQGAEVVVVPSGSCATMARLGWVELFESLGDEETAQTASMVAKHTRELSELLGAYPNVLGQLHLSGSQRVVLHQSCHLSQDLKVRTEPTNLLKSVSGCEIVHWDGSSHCCGFGTTLSVRLPESAALANDDLAALSRLRPDAIVGCDASCLLHLRAQAAAVGQSVEVRHLAEVLADATGAHNDRT